MDDFLLYFACGTSRLSVQQESASVLGCHLLWYHFSMVEMSWWNCCPCLSLTAPRISG